MTPHQIYADAVTAASNARLTTRRSAEAIRLAAIKNADQAAATAADKARDRSFADAERTYHIAISAARLALRAAGSGEPF